MSKMGLASLLLFACGPIAAATQTQLEVIGETASAGGGQTLTNSTQGRINIQWQPNGWTILVVNATLTTESPPSWEYTQLTQQKPWLVPNPTTVSDTLGSQGSQWYIGDRVEMNLAEIGATQLLVRPEDVQQVVHSCVGATFATHDPTAVRQIGQPILTAQTSHDWIVIFPLWGSSPASHYWLPAFARSENSPEEHTQVHWYRLFESLVVSRSSSLQEATAFLRGPLLESGLGIGINLHVQAISLIGSGTLAVATSPLESSGLVVAEPQKVRFSISPPITIAIPYTPPLDEGGVGLPCPYEPGIYNMALPGGLTLAAIGYSPSVNFAIFETGDEDKTELPTPVIRDFEFPALATFVVPVGAAPGVVTFRDSFEPLSPDSSFPLAPFEWNPGDP